MRFLRRRILIDGLQYRMLVASLVYCLVVATVLGACVFGPMLAELRGAPTYSEERVEMANAFLYLSTRLLTFGLLLLALLGFHSVLLSHRIAGPLYRFRQGFKAVARGDLSTRVRIRKNDYLQKEAAGIHEMFDSLKRKVNAIAARSEDVARLLPELAAEVGPEGREKTERLQESVRALTAAVQEFKLRPEESSSRDSRQLEEAAAGTSPKPTVVT
ncbi:MAG: methyl-accepting chemotaxis protein [Planctomycetota bacterium]|nr:methyl-accepting chemotaxis protein [Planctomycetota bacterium]